MVIKTNRSIKYHFYCVKDVYRFDKTLSGTIAPCFFWVYPLKFKLITAKSQTGPGREEDDRLRHTKL